MVLTRASILRSSHPLWNASAPNEGGYADFRRFSPKIGYHNNLPWAINLKEGQTDHAVIIQIMSTFPENLVKIGPSSTFWDNSSSRDRQKVAVANHTVLYYVR